jgi:hypothetical protein
MQYAIIKFDVTEPATGIFQQVGSYDSPMLAQGWIDEALKKGSPNDIYAIVQIDRPWDEIASVIERAGRDGA